MVKTNLIGESTERETRTWREVAEDCVRVLTDPTVTHWISNGEDEKEGRFRDLQCTRKGIIIILHNGKRVTWKMGRKARQMLWSTLAPRYGWLRYSEGVTSVM